MMTKEELPRPSQSEMKRWLDEWQKLADYKAQEAALDRIFKKDDSLRLNKSFEAVLLKCAVLNDFYSTNIYKVYWVAKWIQDRCGNVDARLEQGDPSLVNDIADIGSHPEYKIPRIYSFATKFCSHHKEEKYPIYDSYVHRVLNYYNSREDTRFTDVNTRLHSVRTRRGVVLAPLVANYENFVKTVADFQKKFNLQSSFKDIDRYLWQLGKHQFPKSYGRRESSAEDVS